MSQSLIEEAEEELRELCLSDDERETALGKLPLSLKGAQIYFKAHHLDVGYEGAALIAMKCAGQWEVNTVFDVPSIVALVSQDQSFGRNLPKVFRIRQVQQLFRDLKSRMWLRRFQMPVDSMLDRLAVAFLVCPERLVCANREKQEEAAFLGEKLLSFQDHGNHVVVLLRQTFTGLQCALHLPCTDLGAAQQWSPGTTAFSQGR